MPHPQTDPARPQAEKKLVKDILDTIEARVYSPHHLRAPYDSVGTDTANLICGLAELDRNVALYERRFEALWERIKASFRPDIEDGFDDLHYAIVARREDAAFDLGCAFGLGLRTSRKELKRFVRGMVRKSRRDHVDRIIQPYVDDPDRWNREND